MIFGNVIGVMTHHGEEFNEFHTCYHSIATYDMVQDRLALTFSFIIDRKDQMNPWQAKTVQISPGGTIMKGHSWVTFQLNGIRFPQAA